MCIESTWKGGGYTLGAGSNWNEVRTAGGYVGLPFRNSPGVTTVVNYVYGIYIEGDLCPVCRQRLRDEFNGIAEQMHEKFQKCGGFFAHGTREDAARALLGSLLGNYSTAPYFEDPKSGNQYPIVTRVEPASIEFWTSSR